MKFCLFNRFTLCGAAANINYYEIIMMRTACKMLTLCLKATSFLNFSFCLTVQNEINIYSFRPINNEESKNTDIYFLIIFLRV